MQTIISYTHGVGSGDLSDYALKADQEKDVIGGEVSIDTISLLHRDGGVTDLKISSVERAVKDGDGNNIADTYLKSTDLVEANIADIDSLFIF